MTPLQALGYLFGAAKSAPTASLKEDETLCEAFLLVSAVLRRLSELEAEKKNGPAGPA